MIMYDEYMHALMQMAERVPHGMLTSGFFRACERFAPARIPVKHGKNTLRTSLKVTPSV
jgi:hypothetical protein